jgi:hypothetical protein
MIVRPIDGGVELITQPAHAALAGRIMEHCTALAVHPRRASIQRAICDHDLGWGATDAIPSIDARRGTILDFVGAPTAIRQGVWPRTIAELADDPYAAALVAQHAITVYDRLRDDEEWDGFFASMEASRDGLLGATGHSIDTLTADYAHVRLGDLISLTFCVGWTEPQKYGEWTVRHYGERVVVSPDPFGGVELPVSIDARVIRRTRFASDVELHDTIARGTTRMLTGTISGR